MTPPIARLKAEVYARFGDAFSMGTYNRRKISGSSSWSQHSWANAEDIGVHTLALGDEIFDWLRANAGRLGLRRYGIRRRPALWRVTNHYDHLHVEGLPTMRGTPPLHLPEEEDDDMPAKPSTEDIQAAADAGVFGSVAPSFVAYWSGVPEGDLQWSQDYWPAFYRGLVANLGGSVTPHVHAQPNRTGEMVT